MTSTNKRKSRRNLNKNQESKNYNEEIKSTQTFLDDLILSNQDNYDDLKFIKKLANEYESKYMFYLYFVRLISNLKPKLNFRFN